MSYDETEKYIMERLDRITETGITQEEMIGIYKEWGPIYDKSILVSKYIGYEVAANTVLEYCPGEPGSVTVLDVGAGTGLVGKELHRLGFRTIDAVDPSPESIQEAKDKGVYRNLFCNYFTKDPLDIQEDSYDVIVTSGSLLTGHLPYDCLHEMIRLVKPEKNLNPRNMRLPEGTLPIEWMNGILRLALNALLWLCPDSSLRRGGIICIVTRATTFDNKTVHEYVDKLMPLIKDLEVNGKWKKKLWDTFPEYHQNEKGCKIVYEVC